MADVHLTDRKIVPRQIKAFAIGNKLVAIVLLFIIFLISGCASTKYLGTYQSSLAADACGIDTKRCYISIRVLSTGYVKTSLDGNYFLDNIGGGAYELHGSVKFEIDHPVITNISYLQLTFLFFRGNLVVHEEKFKLYGDVGKYLEFSRTIIPDEIFKSSVVLLTNWRATE